MGHGKSPPPACGRQRRISQTAPRSRSCATCPDSAPRPEAAAHQNPSGPLRLTADRLSPIFPVCHACAPSPSFRKATPRPFPLRLRPALPAASPVRPVRIHRRPESPLFFHLDHDSYFSPVVEFKLVSRLQTSDEMIDGSSGASSDHP